jgi:glycogen operon protein
MTVEDWATSERAAIAFRLDGNRIETAPGTAVHDESFILMLNGEREPVAFSLPPAALGGPWQIVLDTRAEGSPGKLAQAASTLELEAGSAVVWIEVDGGP